jgi:hypothetical protein
MLVVSEENGCRELWEECRQDLPDYGISDSFSFRSVLDAAHGMERRFLIDRALEPRTILPLSRSSEAGTWDWFGTSAAEDNYAPGLRHASREAIRGIVGGTLRLDKINDVELARMEAPEYWTRADRGTKVWIPLDTEPALAGTHHWSAYNLARARRYCVEAGAEWETVEAKEADLSRISEDSIRYFATSDRGSKFSREDVRRRYRLLLDGAAEDVSARVLRCVIGGVRAATVITLERGGIGAVTDVVVNADHPMKRVRDYVFRYAFADTLRRARTEWRWSVADGQGGDYAWKTQVANLYQMKQYTLLLPAS